MAARAAAAAGASAPPPSCPRRARRGGSDFAGVSAAGSAIWPREDSKRFDRVDVAPLRRGFRDNAASTTMLRGAACVCEAEMMMVGATHASTRTCDRPVAGAGVVGPRARLKHHSPAVRSSEAEKPAARRTTWLPRHTARGGRSPLLLAHALSQRPPGDAGDFPERGACVRRRSARSAAAFARKRARSLW